MNSFLVNIAAKLMFCCSLSFQGANAYEAILHEDKKVRALQQHLISVQGLLSTFANDISQYFNQTGTWPSRKRIHDALQDTIDRYPIDIHYVNPDENGEALGASLLIQFTDHKRVDELGNVIDSINLPAALEGKHILLRFEVSPNNTTVERVVCRGDVDYKAGLWDGYFAPLEGELSRILSGLGGVYKDCKYDLRLHQTKVQQSTWDDSRFDYQNGGPISTT